MRKNKIHSPQKKKKLKTKNFKNKTNVWEWRNILSAVKTKDKTSVMKQYGTVAVTYRLSKMQNKNIKK